MPVLKRRGARAPSGRHKSEPEVALTARHEAKAQRDRAKELARIALEYDELTKLDAAAYESLVKLGMRDDEDLDMSSPAIRVLGDVRGDIFSAQTRLRLRKHELEQSPVAGLSETPSETLRRVLVDHGVSRREAARVAGGYASTVDVPSGVRGKAQRDEARRDAGLRLEMRDLKRERRAIDRAPIAQPFDFRHLAFEKIDSRIAEIERLLSRRKAR